MNVPKLRFSEFSDEYSNLYLSDITTLIKDGTHGTHKNYEEGIPLLSAKDIYNNKINIPKDCRRISLEDYNKIYKNYSLMQNDILLTIVGSIGRTALYNNEKISFQRSVATIRINQRNSPKYIRQYIESSIINTQLNNMMNTSAQGGVYLSSLSKLKLNLPNLSEQKKIADMLELLDKKIELQTKKIEALKLFKLCIFKHIFGTATVKIKLKNVSNITKGDQINSEELSKSGSYYMLNGGTEPSGYLEKYNTLENTITISEGGNSCGYVKYNKCKFWCGGHCYSLENKLINNHYLYQLLKFNEKKIMRLRIGSGLPNIQKKDLENFELFIHEKDNQYKIANLLMKYDTKIELEKNKLDKLALLKTGLLQNMFI